MYGIAAVVLWQINLGSHIPIRYSHEDITIEIGYRMGLVTSINLITSTVRYHLYRDMSNCQLGMVYTLDHSSHIRRANAKDLKLIQDVMVKVAFKSGLPDSKKAEAIWYIAYHTVSIWFS